MSETLSVFARRLKEAREEAGLTLRELGEKVRLSESTIARYEKGTIEVKHATLVMLADVLGVNPAWLMGYPGADKYVNKKTDPDVKQVPILGRIAAGQPILAQQYIEGYEYAPVKSGVDFCLIVKGDSMINARIFDGDIVGIRMQSIVENGEIAAVLIGDSDATLKRFYRMNGYVVLRSENPKYPDMVFGPEDMKRVRIIGKAVYLRSEVR